MIPLVKLEIPSEKYTYLLKRLESLKSGIKMLGINQLYKKSLLEDIHVLSSILKDQGLPGKLR